MQTPLTIIEITGSMMVLVMKLSGFAWHVYDGQMPAADIKSATQLASRVERMPDLISFLGYACVSSEDF